MFLPDIEKKWLLNRVENISLTWSEKNYKCAVIERMK
jgi:hypothetical protein